MFNLKIIGVERLQRALGRLSSLGKDIDRVGDAWVKDTTEALRARPYPPPLPNQRYRRTGRLKGSWSSQRTGSGRWVISNSASHRGRFYAGFVVGDNQAAVHKGRWWRARDIVEEQLPKFEEALGKKIDVIWGD